MWVILGRKQVGSGSLFMGATGHGSNRLVGLPISRVKLGTGESWVIF